MVAQSESNVRKNTRCMFYNITGLAPFECIVSSQICIRHVSKAAVQASLSLQQQCCMVLIQPAEFVTVDTSFADGSTCHLQYVILCASSWIL